MMILHRKFGQRRRMTREEKAKEEMEWRRINEEIELESEGVEPLMESYSVYSCEVTGLFLGVFMNLFLIAFEVETQVSERH